MYIGCITFKVSTITTLFLYTLYTELKKYIYHWAEGLVCIFLTVPGTGTATATFRSGVGELIA